MEEVVIENNDVFIQFLSKTFQFLVDLFPKFGWWLAGIIGLTVLVMIPINLLVKKCFSKATHVSLVRIRKAISSLLVYGVAIGALYLYQWLVPLELRPDPELAKNFDFTYVAGDVWSVGTLAMAAWWIIKLVVEVGFGPVLVHISKSKALKELIASCGVDKQIISIVSEKIEDTLKDVATDNSTTIEEYVKANQTAITQQASRFLKSYDQVEKGQIPDVAKVVVAVINAKHKVK